MRSEVDVIMVGSGTALQDDPGLLPRNRRRPTAHRLVLDSRGRLSTSAKLLNDTWSELSVVATGESTSRRKQAAWQRHGAAVWPLPAKGGHLSLKALARRMGKEGWLHVLCEGGGGLAASLLREKLVDELVMIVAPVVMGGGSALPAFGEPGWLLNQAPRFKRIEQCELGQDMLLRLRPETT
jgi:diaminohydroxyphosphoribosylaminopyrimidine deaminase/5-amino-6-(5-phosphoribosylamino)uracil reductase